MKLAIAFNIGCRIIFILQPIRCGAGRSRYSAEKGPSFEQSEMAGGRLNSLWAPSLSRILCLGVFTGKGGTFFLRLPSASLLPFQRGRAPSRHSEKGPLGFSP